MLSHHNLAWTADQGIGMSGVTRDERVVSYLPLSHIAEQMFTLHIAISVGYRVYFAESIPALADNLKEVRPTVFFAVPRVWEKFQTRVTGELAKASGLKTRIAVWAQDATRKAIHATNEGRSPSALVAFQARIADKLVASKVREATGLSDCSFAVSGAAPISQEVLEFFGGFGLSIMEVYGQSEGSGPSTFNQPGRTRFGTVGPPYPGADVEIADDGEVMVRGGNVFMGYYRDPVATSDCLDDGWLASGDLGAFDEDGYLLITGRKKLTALVCLDPDAAAEWAEERGITGPLHESAEALAEIGEAVEAVNARYARVEQIKKFKILPRELTIEDGELTGTLKVKRNVVTEHFSVEIESMYD